MDKLFLIMPAYNEEKNIESVVSQWHKKMEQIECDFKLVVIDDGSKDATYDTLMNLKKKYKQILPLTKGNEGHGPTLIYGYKYAIENGADYIFQTDSDGQTNPNEFDDFWNLRNKYDAIIGNRTKRGDGKSRAFVEKVVCFLLLIFFGVNVPDANAPFRLMKSNLLNKYISRIPDNYNLPNIMLTAFFSKNDEKICFKEVSFESRKAGTNSINYKKILNIGIKSLSDFYKFRKEMKND